MEQQAKLNTFVAERFKKNMAGKEPELTDALRRFTLFSMQQYRTRYLLAKLTQHVDMAYKGLRLPGSLADYTVLEIEHILPNTPTKRQQKFERRRIAHHGMMIMLVFLSVILVIFQSSLMARAGLSLVMLILTLQGLSAIRLARMKRKMEFDLTPRISLLEEQKRVVAEIREARFQSTLHLVPSRFSSRGSDIRNGQSSAWD